MPDSDQISAAQRNDAMRPRKYPRIDLDQDARPIRVSKLFLGTRPPSNSTSESRITLRAR
jgi:hypothetical protein